MNSTPYSHLPCCAALVLVLGACADRAAKDLPQEPMQAQVVECRELWYSDGADPAADRPAHVRAGSAAAWYDGTLAVVQDDASIIALVDLPQTRVDALLLPADPDGARVFDARRGNKAAKLDLEAAFSFRGSLVAFGSGSTPLRDRVVVVDGATNRESGRHVRVVKATELYEALRAESDFSGSELNIEGAAVVGSSVRFFQRGNGAPTTDLEPVNASCDVPVDGLLRYLEDPDRVALPEISQVRQYDLGDLAGVRLTFTDATHTSDGVIFLAVAEDSPDAVRDGVVTGVVVGLIPDGPHVATPRWVQLVGEDGAAFTGKAEGIVLDQDTPGQVFVVTDRDDPDIPAELCTVRLGGFVAAPR